LTELTKFALKKRQDGRDGIPDMTKVEGPSVGTTKKPPIQGRTTQSQIQGRTTQSQVLSSSDAKSNSSVDRGNKKEKGRTYWEYGNVEG
jgi:hypothetical protein